PRLGRGQAEGGRGRPVAHDRRLGRRRGARPGAPGVVARAGGGRPRAPDRAPRVRRARRADPRRPRGRREPADDEVERVRLRPRGHAPRRSLGHAARVGRRARGEARDRARARAPAGVASGEAHRAFRRLGPSRRARRMGRRRHAGAERPRGRLPRPHRPRARRPAGADDDLASVRARRRPVVARPDARPRGVRARARRARARQPDRPRAAALGLPAPLHAPDSARAARLRPRARRLCLMHGHSHDHSRVRDRRLLAVALALIVGLMAGEVAAGLVAGSLALLADAGHMLTDAAALAAALVASRLASRPARAPWTFGLGRAEILAAQLNGIALLLVAVWIVYGAVRRLVSPADVSGGIVLVVALGGVAVNLAATLVLARADRESLNVRGAFLHVATDLAAVAGALVLATGWDRFDPIAGLAVAALCVRSSWSLLRDSGRIFLEGAPPGIDPDAVAAAIAGDDDVVEVHDLHVWTVTSG